MTKRPHISLRLKLAAALSELEFVRHKAFGSPCLTFAEMKAMSMDDYLHRFDFDHVIYHSLRPILPHFTELTPRLRADHQRKTAKVDLPAIAKSKRLTSKQEAFRSRLLAKTGLIEETKPAKRPKRRWPSRPFPRQRREAHNAARA